MSKRKITEFFPPGDPQYPCPLPPKRPCLGVHAYQLECVLPYLCCRDLARVAQVSKTWKHHCSQSRVWSKDKPPELVMKVTHGFKSQDRQWQDYQLGSVKKICITGIADDDKEREEFRRVFRLCTNVQELSVLTVYKEEDWICEVLALLFATGARFVFNTTGSSIKYGYALSDWIILGFIARNISPSLCGYKVDSAVLPPAPFGTVFHPHVKAIECAGYADITPYPNLEFLNIHSNRKYNHRFKWDRVVKCENPDCKVKSLIVHETNRVFDEIAPCVLNSIEHLRCTVRDVVYFEKQFKILFEAGYLQKLKRLEVFIPVVFERHKLRLDELKPKIPLELVLALTPYYDVDTIRLVYPSSKHVHPRIDVTIIKLRDTNSDWSYSEPFRGVKQCASTDDLFNQYARAANSEINNTPS